MQPLVQSFLFFREGCLMNHLPLNAKLMELFNVAESLFLDYVIYGSTYSRSSKGFAINQIAFAMSPFVDAEYVCFFMGED